MRRICASAAILLVAGMLAACGGGSSKTDDAAANEAILSQLPVYPHAQVYSKSVNPYYPEDGGLAAPLGHTTNVDYEVQKGTDQVALIRFYSSRLQPEWHCRTERIGAIRLPSAPPGTPASRKPGRRLPGQTELLLHCKRGTAILGLNPDNLGSTPPRYELVVDHNDRTP